MYMLPGRYTLRPEAPQSDSEFLQTQVSVIMSMVPSLPWFDKLTEAERDEITEWVARKHLDRPTQMPVCLDDWERAHRWRTP